MYDRNIPISINAPLQDRILYAPDTVTSTETLHALDLAQAVFDVLNNGDLDAMIEFGDWPEDAAQGLTKLIDSHTCRASEDKIRDLESFFDDCVQSLDGYWPCASIEDQTLRSVIINAIRIGETLPGDIDGILNDDELTADELRDALRELLAKHRAE